jgi:hypothetical protein
MTGPAADTEREMLGGGDAVSRAIRASDGVELHHLRWCSGRAPPWAVAPTARLAILLTPELYTGNPRYLDAIRADRLRLPKATLPIMSRFWSGWPAELR